MYTSDNNADIKQRVGLNLLIMLNFSLALLVVALITFTDSFAALAMGNGLDVLSEEQNTTGSGAEVTGTSDESADGTANSPVQGSAAGNSPGETSASVENGDGEDTTLGLDVDLEAAGLSVELGVGEDGIDAELDADLDLGLPEVEEVIEGVVDDVDGAVDQVEDVVNDTVDEVEDTVEDTVNDVLDGLFGN